MRWQSFTERSDPALRRTGRRLAVPGRWFTGLGMIPLIAGILLLVFASGWAFALGIVLIAMSLPFFGLGFGLLASSGIAEWASKRWPFA